MLLLLLLLECPSLLRLVSPVRKSDPGGIKNVILNQNFVQVSLYFHSVPAARCDLVFWVGGSGSFQAGWLLLMTVPELLLRTEIIIRFPILKKFLPEKVELIFPFLPRKNGLS
jgi:hypothetical protein